MEEAEAAAEEETAAEAEAAEVAELAEAAEEAEEAGAADADAEEAILETATKEAEKSVLEMATKEVKAVEKVYAAAAAREVMDRDEGGSGDSACLQFCGYTRRCAADTADSVDCLPCACGHVELRVVWIADQAPPQQCPFGRMNPSLPFSQVALFALNKPRDINV